MRTVNTVELKVWMLRNGVTQTGIAEELGCTRNWIWQTVHGLRPGARVVKKLLEKGCPPKLLGLSEDDAEEILEGREAA